MTKYHYKRNYFCTEIRLHVYHFEWTLKKPTWYLWTRKFILALNNKRFWKFWQVKKGFNISFREQNCRRNNPDLEVIATWHRTVSTERRRQREFMLIYVSLTNTVDLIQIDLIQTRVNSLLSWHRPPTFKDSRHERILFDLEQDGIIATKVLHSGIPCRQKMKPYSTF